MSPRAWIAALPLFAAALASGQRAKTTWTLGFELNLRARDAGAGMCC
jgi:hypothetical protein